MGLEELRLGQGLVVGGPTGGTGASVAKGRSGSLCGRGEGGDEGQGGGEGGKRGGGGIRG